MKSKNSDGVVILAAFAGMPVIAALGVGLAVAAQALAGIVT